MEECQRCHETDYDRRTLWMRCFYDMNELGLPFQDIEGYFTLKVCKDCRADWMAAIVMWFKEFPKIKMGCGSGIFVRENGSTVEITEEEWYKRNPDREPVGVSSEPNA